MKVSFALFLIFWGCASNKNQNLVDVDLQVKKFELKNGLKVLLVEDHRLPIYSLYTFFNVGGKNEQKGITGASHFLEHLMFKGARKYTGSQFDYLIEGNGGSNNAYTTNDMTVYYESLPSSTLEMMLDVEADRMVNLLLEKESFEQERKVVLEERKMRYENSPRGQAYLTMMESLFKGTPYGTSVIGDVEDLVKVSRDDIQNYFKKFYAPNNAILIVVGDFNTSEVKRIIEKKYGDLPRSELVESSQKAVTDDLFKWHFSPKTYNLHGKSPLPMFMMAFPAYKQGTSESYALDMLSSVLTEGKSSYLNQKFVLSKKPEATNIWGGNSSFFKSGAFMIGGDLVKDVKSEEFLQSVKNEIQDVCENKMNETDLVKVKNQFLVDLYDTLSTNSGLAQFLGNHEIIYGDYNAYIKDMQIYNSLTIEDLKKSCKNLLSSEPVNVVVWEKFKNKG